MLGAKAQQDTDTCRDVLRNYERHCFTVIAPSGGCNKRCHIRNVDTPWCFSLSLVSTARRWDTDIEHMCTTVFTSTMHTRPRSRNSQRQMHNSHTTNNIFCTIVNNVDKQLNDNRSHLTLIYFVTSLVSDLFYWSVFH